VRQFKAEMNLNTAGTVSTPETETRTDENLNTTL